jgi:cell wall assembly regulator SMI1
VKTKMTMPANLKEDVQQLWTTYESWLSVQWPEGLARLQAPATDDHIARLEAVLQAKLPDDLIACLKIHNGQSGFGPLLGGWDFLSVEEIQEQWQVWAELVDAGDFDGYASEPEAGIRDDWYNRKWVPFTHDGAGNHLCVDLDPASSGQYGQVITMWHDGAERELKAPSFLAFLSAYVEGVLAGEYVCAEDYGGIVEARDL